MGRNAGGHTDCNTVRSVHQKVRQTDRQDAGFLLRLIEIRNKIHHIFIQIRQEGLLGYFLKACLGVSHGGGAVALDGAKIAVSVHQGHALFKILGHDHQGIVDGAVAVGVVFTHGIADDTGAFSIRAVIADATLVHIIKGSALYRL